MKKALNVLWVVVILIAFASCERENLTPQLSSDDIAQVESEAKVESVIGEVDDISYEAVASVDAGGRIAVDERSLIECAVRTHDTENKTIIIDYGDGCYDYRDRLRQGKVIIHYTDFRFVPGAVRTITFNNFYIDSVKVEGTRVLTNTSESEEDTLRFQVEFIDGKFTFPEGYVIHRNAIWTKRRVRALNPIDDVILLDGEASGTTFNGNEYTVEITKTIVIKRGCDDSWLRLFIPVEGTKVYTLGENTKIVDYGNGECDNLMTITRNGITREVEVKMRKILR